MPTLDVVTVASFEVSRSVALIALGRETWRWIGVGFGGRCLMDELLGRSTPHLSRTSTANVQRDSNTNVYSKVCIQFNLRRTCHGACGGMIRVAVCAFENLKCRALTTGNDWVHKLKQSEDL